MAFAGTRGGARGEEGSRATAGFLVHLRRSTAFWRILSLVVVAAAAGIAIAIALWTSRIGHQARISRSITAPRARRASAPLSTRSPSRWRPR